MNKYPTKLLLFILCLFWICSCTEKADLDSKDVQVYAILENADVQTIILQQKAYASQNGYLPIEDADVKIEEVVAGQSNIYVFEGKGNGTWTANFRPEPNAEYKLTITCSKHNTISASTIYPDTLKFISYNVNPTEKGNNCIEMPEIAKPVYKTAQCYIWMHYADYLPETQQWKVSDSTVVVRDWAPWQAEHEGILPKLGNDAVVIAYYYNPLQEHDIVYSKYKRYSGAGRCEAAKCIPFLAQYMSPEQKGVTLYGFEEADIPYIHMTGRQYKARQEDFTATHGSGLLHPESYIMMQSTDLSYDRYLRETYAIDPKLDHIDTKDISKCSNIYTNLINATGIFGCTYKYKLFLKNCRGENETPIWELASANLN